jgi:DNA-binding MarR family transcriptional regulator
VEVVADRLHSAALHLLRRLRREDDALGVSPPRLSALSVVVYAGPIGIGELARIEGVSAPTMTRLVDGLEREGLVVREARPDDRRGVLVRSTRRGSAVLRSGRSRRVRALADALRDLGPADMETLARATTLIERIGRRR